MLVLNTNFDAKSFVFKFYIYNVQKSIYINVHALNLDNYDNQCFVFTTYMNSNQLNGFNLKK